MTSELTPWFARDTNPTRPGVYEILMFSTLIFSKWTGVHWCAGRAMPDDAAAVPTGERHWIQRVNWRGFTTEQHLVFTEVTGQL